jgi:hypothetical protein
MDTRLRDRYRTMLGDMVVNYLTVPANDGAES